jgi:hypothetical protein
VALIIFRETGESGVALILQFHIYKGGLEEKRLNKIPAKKELNWY